MAETATAPTPVWIALLRGINVGGHNRIPMADLRALCAGLGWADVQTYIASGNVVFRAEAERARLEAELAAAIAARWGFDVPVIVRSAGEWAAYLPRLPFAEAARTEPNLVMLGVSRSVPPPDAGDRLRERAAASERIVQDGDVFWIHYDRGVAGSKLTPGLLDRVAGSPVTTRNWRTVVKLAELAGAGT